jgi:hypothetical protein
MTRLILSLLLISAQTLTAQRTTRHLPDGDSTFSLVTQEMREEFDTILAYTEESYWWSDHPVYKLFARKDKKWMAIQIEGRWKKNGELKVSSRNFETDTQAAELFLNGLELSGFWSIKTSDTVSASHLSDGIYYRFELITKDSTRIVEIYEPEAAQTEKNPSILQFLAGREQFFKLWNQKSKL